METKPSSAVPSDLLLIALGWGTSALTALVLAAVSVYLHFALFAVSFWGVVPIGAVMCGMVAASGTDGNLEGIRSERADAQRRPSSAGDL